jgi:type VI protein secretion system component Hcp
MSDEKENKTSELSDQDFNQVTGGNEVAPLQTQTPKESVSLPYGKIKVTYTQQKPDGTSD